MDIFIVLIVRLKDGSRTPYWIDADDKAMARRRALKLLGKNDIKIVSIKRLGDLATSGVAKRKTRKRKVAKPPSKQ